MHGCSGGGACMVAGGHVWLLWGGHALVARGHAWDTMRYRDTINERAVRILLESGWPHSSQDKIPCVFP